MPRETDADFVAIDEVQVAGKFVLRLMFEQHVNSCRWDSRDLVIEVFQETSRSVA
jgi:hypothetical protein